MQTHFFMIGSKILRKSVFRIKNEKEREEMREIERERQREIQTEREREKGNERQRIRE